MSDSDAPSSVQILQAKCDKIDNPLEVLALLVEMIDDGYFGHDPYYADLSNVAVQCAQRVLAKAGVTPGNGCGL